MWRLLKNTFHRLRLWSYRRRIERALALASRGQVRSDNLQPNGFSSRLYIEWCARDIHPWDSDAPPQERAQLFARQCLDDTEVAITKLFDGLPELDVLDIKVTAPDSDEVLLAGTVHRTALADGRTNPLSTKMRLNDLGVRWRILEPYLEQPPDPGTRSGVPTG